MKESENSVEQERNEHEIVFGAELADRKTRQQSSWVAVTLVVLIGLSALCGYVFKRYIILSDAENGELRLFLTDAIPSGNDTGHVKAFPINDGFSVAAYRFSEHENKRFCLKGMDGSLIPPEAAEYFRIPEGIEVYSVDAESAMEKAGIRRGDVITSINGISAVDIDVVASFHGENVFDVVVFRDGDTLAFHVR